MGIADFECAERTFAALCLQISSDRKAVDAVAAVFFGAGVPASVSCGFFHFLDRVLGGSDSSDEDGFDELSV